MFGNLCTIVKIIVFDIVFPTADAIGDVTFSIEAFSNSHFLIGFAMSIFVIFSVAYEVYTWKTTDFDSENEKTITWLFSFLHIWPQYQSCKVIYSYLTEAQTGSWKNKQRKTKAQLSYIEPLIESIPQFFVECSIYAMLVTRDSGGANQGYGTNMTSFYTAIWSDSGTEVEKIFGATTFGISNQSMFPLKVLISLLSGIKCVVESVYNGEANMKSDCRGYNAITFVSILFYTISSFLWKMHIVQQITMFGADLQIHGFWIFFIVFLLLIFIPSLFIYPPLIQYFGFRKMLVILGSNPKFIMIPLITEFVYGPSNGYRPSPCQTESELAINKGHSLSKLIYFFIFLCFFSHSIVTLLNEEYNCMILKIMRYQFFPDCAMPSLDKTILVMHCILVPFLILAFLITLLCRPCKWFL